MKTHRRRRRWAILLATLLTGTLGAVPAQAAGQGEAAESPSAATVALYADRTIDIAQDWEGAGACVVWPEVLDVSECFDTEAQMDRRIGELEAELAIPSSGVAVDGVTAALGSSCSSYLRLYDGSWYTGAVLYMRGRGQWFNLADYGFDQWTSSFKIGACSAWFADWANGGGAWYPTSQTEAYDVAPTMTGGWNNDVLSIYIT